MKEISSKKYLVITSRIKQYFCKQGIKVSSKSIEALHRIVLEKCEKAIQSTLKEKRKTVLYRDFCSRNKIVECKVLSDYRVWICFEDGLYGEVDLSHLVGIGIFELWKEIEFFEKVYIDPITCTLTWNKELDLCPDSLRKKIKPSIT